MNKKYNVIATYNWYKDNKPIFPDHILFSTKYKFLAKLYIWWTESTAEAAWLMSFTLALEN